MTRLGPEEKVLWVGTRAWSEFLAWWFLGGVVFGAGIVLLTIPKLRLVGGAAILLSLLSVVAIWISRASRRYTVTSERAIVRRGLVSRNIAEIELKHIRDIQVKQSALQRILRTGTLALSSAGRAEAEIVFEGIPNPEGVKEVVRQGMRGPS